MQRRGIAHIRLCEGYAKAEMLALGLRDLAPEEAADTFPDFIDESNTTDGVFVWISSRKKDGAIFPIQ